jgi:colanic acid biosynthesis glycosyl transferase WcaI
MKILFYGINYYPELTGIGKYTEEMASWMAAQGHSIRVVTAPPYYPEWKVRHGYSSWRYTVEKYNGVEVWRSPLWVPLRPSGWNRILHLVSFAISSFPLLCLQLFWRPDVILTISPAMVCAPGGLVAAIFSRARCWLHLQDFEIDAAFELGLLKGERLRSLALGFERWLLQRFDRVSTISEAMISILYKKQIDKKKIVYLPNWVNTKNIFPITREVDTCGSLVTEINTYRAELKIPSDAIVAIYSGSMGEKQGLEILGRAAQLTKNRDNLFWVFCGEGGGRESLEQYCAGLANVRFQSLQPSERLNELLNLGDIHLLPQRADVADLVMPSKLTGILSSGRPVVTTALPGTSLARICEQCGLVTATGDAKALVEAVISLADNALLRANYGAIARSYAESHFSQDLIMNKIESEFFLLIKK